MSIELDDDSVESYILCISTGVLYRIIDEEFIFFKYPDNKLRMKADLFYDKEYEKAIFDGLLDRNSMEKLIEKRNLFTEEDQKKLDRLNSKLEAQKVLLGKTTRVKANQDRIKGVIEGLENEIREITYKKSSKLMMSAEVKANEERTLYLCWASTFDDYENLYWKNYEDFKNTNNVVFRDKIIYEFVKFYSGVPLKTMRFIARHNLWRIRYVNSQKTGEPLFGVSSSNYTTDMLNLVYWSNFYDNIYQMMPEDKPSDSVIEDDDALDAYMKSYYEERNKEDAARRSNKKTPGKLSAFNKEEVIVTASNELWKDIDYDKPKEAQKLKERSDIRKRTKKG